MLFDKVCVFLLDFKFLGLKLLESFLLGGLGLVEGFYLGLLLSDDYAELLDLGLVVN